MQRPFWSAIALFLIPCLVAHPAFAGGICPSKDTPSFFAEQAFSLVGLWSQKLVAGHQGFAPRQQMAWGPAASGQNWRDVVWAMIQEEVGAGKDPVVSSYYASQKLYDTISSRWEFFLPEPVIRKYDEMARESRISAAFREHLEAWLKDAIDEELESLAMLINWSVRYRLRKNSTLAKDRYTQDAVLSRIHGILAELDVEHYVVYGLNHPVMQVWFPMAEGGVKVELEVVSHAAADGYVDSLNLPLGRMPEGHLLFTAMLQERTSHISGKLKETMEIELWEIGLRSLGYSVDDSMKSAKQFVGKRPLSDLRNWPRENNRRAVGIGAASYSVKRAA